MNRRDAARVAADMGGMMIRNRNRPVGDQCGVAWAETIFVQDKPSRIIYKRNYGGTRHMETGSYEPGILTKKEEEVTV